jgi:hypothetical protein
MGGRRPRATADFHVDYELLSVVGCSKPFPNLLIDDMLALLNSRMATSSTYVVT